jgi:hypothetical protein
MQQLYNCVVRLGGSMKNEVRKDGVTASEIKVLKIIHNGPETGVEVVYNIARAGTVDRDDYEERERLEETYGRALAKIEHVKTLTQVLGHETVPLPQTIRGVDTLPPPKTGKRAAPRQPAPEPDPEPINEAEFA